MDNAASWIATAATIIAACMTASNLGSRITGYGFAVFTIGSIAWLAVGLLTGQPALVWTNVVMTILNVFGIWRWLGRQAKVEEGAEAAAQASESAPGETLFPASLLAHAKVRCSDAEAGNSVDAMLGSRSGRLSYLVVSEGGVAGVGETLRRVPWKNARVEGGEVVVHVSLTQFRAFETVQRDNWPSR